MHQTHSQYDMQVFKYISLSLLCLFSRKRVCYLHTQTHTSYLAALSIVVELVTGGEQEAVLCCGLLSARSTVVTIIYTTGTAPHTPHTQHLQGQQEQQITLRALEPHQKSPRITTAIMSKVHGLYACKIRQQ